MKALVCIRWNVITNEHTYPSIVNNVRYTSSPKYRIVMYNGWMVRNCSKDRQTREQWKKYISLTFESKLKSWCFEPMILSRKDREEKTDAHRREKYSEKKSLDLRMHDVLASIYTLFFTCRWIYKFRDTCTCKVMFLRACLYICM